MGPYRWPNYPKDDVRITPVPGHPGVVWVTRLQDRNSTKLKILKEEACKGTNCTKCKKIERKRQVATARMLRLQKRLQEIEHLQKLNKMQPNRVYLGLDGKYYGYNSVTKALWLYNGLDDGQPQIIGGDIQINLSDPMTPQSPGCISPWNDSRRRLVAETRRVASMHELS